MEVNKEAEIISKSIKKLNPESDRYRICPECKIPFMADHRSRDFHPGKCADDYNNRKKKLAKQALEMSNSVSTKEILNSHEVTTINPPMIKEVISPIDNDISVSTKSIVRREELILSQLLTGKIEVEINWEYISQLGFDFTAFDSIEKLPHCELNKANYGAYSILWTQADKILITNQKYLLWTSTQ